MTTWICNECGAEHPCILEYGLDSKLVNNPDNCIFTFTGHPKAKWVKQ